MDGTHGIRTPDDTEDAVRILARLERRIGLSRLAVLWERLWPALVLPAAIIAAFLAFSWFGLWSTLGETGRAVVLVVFGVAFLIGLVPIARLQMPSRREAIQRLDTTEGILHRPVGALADRLPAATTDETTRALWRLHVERELARADAVRVERPRPGLSERDPYRLRYAVALIALVAFIQAGPASFDRIAAAFRGAPAPVVVPPRIDAWVTPPAYTGRPPLFLTAERRVEDGPVRVPQGSIVSVRVDRSDGITVRLGERSLEGAVETGVAVPGGPRLFRETLARDEVVALAQEGAAPREWRFAVEPDLPPKITLEGQVQQMAGGALRVRYRVEDDWGVATAFARIDRVVRTSVSAARPTLALTPPADARPLYGAPEFPLTLPQARTRSGQGTTTRDLTNHPWAGARVSLSLVARDDAEQEGRSETVFIELPQRRFEKPLARAVIELRRQLAMDAEQRERVAGAIDLLTLEPERRIPETKVYLALRVGYHRLLNARTDDDLRGIVDHLWDVALLIEDGDLSAAERALRQAQERLEQALERGATPEEIRRLMEELRQALNEMMREMARQMQRDQQQGREQSPPQPNERVISQADIERMMREIEDLMRSGNRDAARNLMAQLRDLLDQLRNARPTMQGRQGEQQQMMDELGNMIREQQRLMDQTFRQRQQNRNQQQQQGRQQQRPGQQQQGQRRPGQQQPGQQGEQGEGEPGESEQAMRDLQQGQGQLRDQLQQFLDRLQRGGRQPGRELGDAQGQMGQAEQQLGQGNPGEALGPQNRALDNLRRGAQQMARDMMGEGQGDPNGQPGQGQGQANNQRRPNMNDPLQRNLPPDESLNSDVRVPERADRQRVQEILEDVRRRLSDPARPQIEMDYLQRLLRPF